MLVCKSRYRVSDGLDLTRPAGKTRIVNSGASNLKSAFETVTCYIHITYPIMFSLYCHYTK